MTANDLEELARQMVAGPAPKPYKKVFAWIGRPDSLRGVIPTRAMARECKRFHRGFPPPG